MRWGLVVAVLGVGCHRRVEPVAVVEPGLVPRAREPITIDGAWREPAWNVQALTGDLLGDDHAVARPVSQLRLLADDRRLLVGLYAADEDIRTTDHFDLTIGAVTLRYDPLGHVTPAIEGAHATVDTDGTLDHPEDYDEEWVIEADVPLARVGLTPGGAPVAVTARRCDVTKDGVQRCGTWTGAVHLGAP